MKHTVNKWILALCENRLQIYHSSITKHSAQAGTDRSEQADRADAKSSGVWRKGRERYLMPDR